MNSQSHATEAKFDWKHALVFPLLVYTASRVVTFAVAGIIAIIEPSRDFLGVLSNWDGGWYLSIVENGYPSELASKQSELSYFPAYPLTIKGVQLATGLRPEIAGVLTSLVLGGAAAVAVWIFAERLCDHLVADRSVLLVCFFPSSFALSMVYTEGLYILLAATCLQALFRKQWLVAGVASGLASATRINGMVLALACLIASVLAIRRDRQWRSIMAPALAPLGGVAFFSYLYLRTGEPLAPIRSTARGWDQELDWGRATLEGIARFLRTFDFEDAQTILPIVLVGACLLGFYLILRWRPPLPIVFYTLVSLALIVLTRQTYSGPRYLLGAFPAIVAGARFLSGRWTQLALGVSGTLMTALFVLTGTTDLAP